VRRQGLLRSWPLLLGAILVAGCATASDKSGSSSPDRPNLVVILADDAGAECFGCYGGESYRTPSIDRMAAEGVRFANAFTQPLCTPTRVELLTGRSNARNYVAFGVLDPAERTFATRLRDAGYRTFAAGKWQLLGAEHYPEPLRGTGSTPARAGFDGHVLWQVERLGRRHWSPTLTENGVTTTLADDVYGPDFVLDRALRWIDDGADGDAPFLLYWPMILPHAPFIAPPGHDGPRQARGHPSQFGPMVEHLDAQLGRLLAHLETRGLARDTIVIFAGDNGSPRPITSRRDGRDVVGGKGRPIDAGSRVPFIMWAPGRLPAGRTVASPVSTVDVLPTLLAAAGVPAPDDRALDGTSLLPAATGGQGPRRAWVAFHHHPRPVTRPRSTARRWARDERWQLFDDGRLFDVADDPLLQRPLAPGAGGDEAARARVRLAAGLAALPSPE
jgi:arylsulfatase A-like enzyme